MTLLLTFDYHHHHHHHQNHPHIALSQRLAYLRLFVSEFVLSAVDVLIYPGYAPTSRSVCLVHD